MKELLRGSTRAVARRLLGARLVHDSPEGRTVGRIVETEAYLSAGDGASHSRMGPTARNASMFLAAGHAYVYRIYGVHRCFNVVTGPEGRGEAVLVRALEPLEGEALMRARRGRPRPREWCAGPARLVQAMAIGAQHDGAFLGKGTLRLLAPERSWRRGPVDVGARVGIQRSADLALRFQLHGNAWCSRGPIPRRTASPSEHDSSP